MTATTLNQQLQERFGSLITISDAFEECTISLAPNALLEVANALKLEPAFSFECLMDVSGLDYLDYGSSEWQTESSSGRGFERAVIDKNERERPWTGPRFAVSYHLLSLSHNRRLRLKVPIPEAELECPSLVEVWPAANWYEREAYDLFGIVFANHPDLRRLLTDYGFIGHPFRKDFPLIGHVEMRYDAAAARVIYQPVTIKNRTLVPKVLRQDNRYIAALASSQKDSGRV